MSIMDRIVTTAPRAPRITIYGKPGIGKSSLASRFPSPLFLLTEDPALNNIQALPVAKSFLEFWGNVKELLAMESLPYETIVVDSVSKLDALVVRYILEEDESNKKSKDGKAMTLGSCCGGYGKGYERAQGIHRAIKAQLDKFVNRGIGVVFISHIAVTKYKAPDHDDYDTYSIVMNHDKSREVYIDDVDAVLFGRLKSYSNTLESGRNIIQSTDKRILVTAVNDATVAKNRYDMPAEIPMDFDEIKKYIPYYNLEKN